MYQNLFFGAGAGRSRDFMSGAGGPEPYFFPGAEKKIWRRSRGKMTPQHW